ncbi:phage/plasmid primase, P4 family [Streptomyces sp. NPDC093249]|uniref:phage/plasmid primase, P4 family n=1 Tax=unclassified Streptomyces TaxID=2593676 RepID=UPI003819971F
MTRVPESHDGLFDPAEVARQILLSAARAVPPQAPPPAVTPHATEDGLLPDSLSDRGSAKLFVALYGRDFRHVPGIGWYRWSGYRWAPDEDDTVVWAAGEMAESLAENDPAGRHSTTDLRRHKLIGFLHELLGYSITGDVGAQIMPFLYGQGKNGKSVLLEVMVKLLGDYADAAPPGFLMARPFEGHPTDLAELHGRRIIVCSELKPGDRFDEARVKLLTGGDRIKARRMRQDFFSFTPTHKLWLLGNHRPEVGTGGYAFWRRMTLIPFERVVATDRQIDNLADVLVTEEGPGIMHWLVRGAGRYLEGPRDLTGPDQVRTATTAYAETEDHTGRFLGECCTLHPAMRAEQRQLYNSYTGWCQMEGANPVSSRSFAARVRETIGISTPRQMILSNQRKFYPGIGLDTEGGGRV